MFYRIYDKVLENWITKDVYLTPYGQLVVAEQAFFNNIKLKSADPNRYILHRSSELYDKYFTLIFEGDVVKVKFPNVEEEVYMLVAYNSETASFILLDYKNLKFYELMLLDNSDCCEHIEVIGNTIENRDLIEFEENKES